MHEFKRRFPPPPPDWSRPRLADIAERVTTRNAERNPNVLTISAEFGLISQNEFFSRRVASESVTGYFLLERGDFAYNKSYSRGYPLGAIRRLDRYTKGCVSPLYICFRPQADAVDSDFLLHYLDGGAMDAGLADIAKEGVRNHGLLNVGVSDFFSLEVPLPPVAEQRVAAQVLNTLDATIRQTDAIIEKLKHVKQGLLHDLLTRGIDVSGELRPSQNEAPHLYKDSPLGLVPREWEVRPAEEACAAVIDCKNRTPPDRASGHAVIRTSNVRDGQFVSEGLTFTDAASYAIWTQRGKPRAGDILITREAPVGEVCLLPAEIGEACLGQRMMMYRPAPDALDANFMLVALMSARLQKVLRDLSGGSTVGHVRVGDIRTLPIPIPSLDEQRKIASSFDTLQRRLLAEEAELVKLAALKSGLMDDLLTGRVRVAPLLA